MPVELVTVNVTMRKYECRCKDCKSWVRRYDLKANADTAMLGHRILSHAYTPLFSVLDRRKLA